MCPRDHHAYCRVKRWGDAMAAAVLLVILLPVMAVVAAVVATGLGRPILFHQSRPGAHGVPFNIIKFRTMLNVDLARGRVTDSDRLTRLGRVLRSMSLDELPGLVNVLRGDMSFVGPRPLLPQYLSRYTPEQARRHDVRPGVTGLAQIRGRNSAAWSDRLRWDVEYVDSHSLATDAVILWRTIGVVLRRTGISASGHATVEEFQGSLAGASR